MHIWLISEKLFDITTRISSSWGICKKHYYIFNIQTNRENVKIIWQSCKSLFSSYIIDWIKWKNTAEIIWLPNAAGLHQDYCFIQFFIFTDKKFAFYTKTYANVKNSPWQRIILWAASRLLKCTCKGNTFNY